MISPTVRSLFALMLATLMMSSSFFTSTGREILASSLTSARTAASIPRLMPLASKPATTCLRPSR